MSKILTAAQDGVGGRRRLKTGSHVGAMTKVQTGRQEGQSLAMVVAGEPFLQQRGERERRGAGCFWRKREAGPAPGGEDQGHNGYPAQAAFGESGRPWGNQAGTKAQGWRVGLGPAHTFNFIRSSDHSFSMHREPPVSGSGLDPEGD